MDNSVPEKAEAPAAASPSRGAITILKDYFQSFGRKRKTTTPKRTWRERIALLTFSQWTYFAAFILLLFSSDNGDFESSGVIWVGLLAAVGLSREIWHLFHRMWHTTLGKGVFLVLYAATANFALAIAAMKVNLISGIEPAPLRFTLGFTTLIMLPLWIFVASVVMACVLLMVSNLWLLIAGLLRIIRIRVRVHWEDQSFAVVSMILRIILLPIFISSLYFIFKPYVEQVYTFNIPIDIIQADLSAEQRAELKNLDANARLEKLQEFAEQGDLATNQSSSDTEEPTDVPQPRAPGVIDKLIASFIFNMETYPNSSCAKEIGQHVLTIDDYSMLVAERDSDSELGYRFSIAPCQQAYSSAEMPAE